MNKIKVIEFLDYKVYRIVIGQAARMLWGNDSGIFNNLSGRKSIKRATRNFPHVVNLLDNGFSLLGYDFHDRDLIKNITKEFNYAVAEVESRTPESRKVVIIEPLLRKIPLVKKILSYKLREILDNYYGADSWKLYRAEAWRNYYWGEPTGKEIHSDLMHNDYDSTEILRVFIYLNDGITRENGATKLLSSIDTRSTMRRGYVTRYKMTKSSRKLMESRSIYMEGDSGFSFIFNPQLCLHAAGRTKPNGIRDVVVLSFCKSEKPFGFEQINDLEKEQSQRLESGLSIEWK